MKAIVVYESLWGYTAAIARAIAEGLGPEARAISTAEASSEVIADADLLVAGAPVHSLGIPSDTTREWARTGSLGPGGAPPDLSHPMMRTWLDKLPKGHGRSAAFDTRVESWYGHGAAPKILHGLKRAGYRPIAKVRGFFAEGLLGERQSPAAHYGWNPSRWRDRAGAAVGSRACEGNGVADSV
jgi:hypothetical protein